MASGMYNMLHARHLQSPTITSIYITSQLTAFRNPFRYDLLHARTDRRKQRDNAHLPTRDPFAPRDVVLPPQSLR